MKTKYFYNTVTREFCGTDEPLGDNFAFTYEKPPKAAEADEAILFKDDRWIVEKIVIEEPKISVEVQIEQLMQERKDARAEMTACMLVDDEDGAKQYAKRMKEIDAEIEALRAMEEKEDEGN